MGNIDTSGFYKQEEDGSWIYAPNFVYGFNFELLRERKDSYEYPANGWTWYDENKEVYLTIYPEQTQE